IDKMRLIVSFQTDPDRIDELTKVVFDELGRLAATGIAEDDLQKSKEYMRKAMERSLESNYYWQSMLNGYITSGRDKHTNYEAILADISVVDIQQLLRGLLESRARVHVTMRPAVPVDSAARGTAGTRFETGLSWQEVR